MYTVYFGEKGDYGKGFMKNIMDAAAGQVVIEADDGFEGPADYGNLPVDGRTHTRSDKIQPYVADSCNKKYSTVLKADA